MTKRYVAKRCHLVFQNDIETCSTRRGRWFPALVARMKIRFFFVLGGQETGADRCANPMAW